MRGYVAKRRNRFYAVIYEGIDPITGRERRRWYPAGTDRAEAEQHAQAAFELARISAVDPKSSSWIGEALVLRARAEAAAGSKTAPATAQEALSHLVANLDPTHPLIAQAREIASGLAH